MHKLYLSASVLVLFTGCAVSPSSSEHRLAAVADSNAPPKESVAAAAPVASHDISDFDQVTVCEDVKSLGSRIIRGQVCYTHDASYAATLDERRRQEVELVQREFQRQQEHLDRMQREREMARQTAIMQQGMRQQ
jgi:hypothetical protein